MPIPQNRRFRSAPNFFRSLLAVPMIAIGPGTLALRAAPPPGYTLVWSDEFKGTSLDTTKWTYLNWNVGGGAIDTPDAVSVANGLLTITTYTSGGTNYTGAIATLGRFAPTYGYMEARIRFKTSSGTSSAFWTQGSGNNAGAPASSGVEYDVVEYRANDSAYPYCHFDAATHYSGYGTSEVSASNYYNNPALLKKFHTYGLEWTPTSTTYYVDGAVVWTGGANPAVSNSPEYLILDQEVHTNGWAGPIPSGGYGDLSASTCTMDVDYVRYYQTTP